MFPKLKISAFVLKRLERIKQQCMGCLFGVMYADGTLLVLGFNLETTIGQLNYKQIQHKFPAEIDLCGLVNFGDCTDAELHIKEILQDVDITDNPIMLCCGLGTLVDLKASVFMHGQLQDIPYEIMPETELFSDFCFTRLRCNLNLLTETDSNKIANGMQKLRKSLAGGSLVFQIRNTKIYLMGSSNPENSYSPPFKSESKIGDVLDAANKAGTTGGGDSITSKSKKSNKNIVNSEYEVLDIIVLKNKTRDATESTTSLRQIVQNKENRISIPLEVDAMAMLFKKTAIMGLYDILIESICRSLRLIEQTFIDRVNQENAALSIPRTRHFSVTEFGHFLSCVHLDGVPDDDPHIQQKRKKLHHHLGLPITRPYFRRTNRYIFKDELPSDAPLINTHIGLKPSGVKDGKQYLVQGKYSYYHYMQQKFDDKGWGCAYRSLQTICSWFRWQGYTERSIPSHEEIQKHLVAIGDKSPNFVGSKQWIGSTEVSMCLSGLLNVESKIMHVSSGADLSTKGSELAMHFESQGTPIMIGGGVLAHTIIGIDFNQYTGELKFLILDPHYTDADDLNTIQTKGWCGWKDIKFWDKKSYYNLCMPQRPIMY